jgi:hypothetical protein
MSKDKAFIGFHMNIHSGEIEAVIISRYAPTAYDIINMVRREIEVDEMVDILGTLIKPKHTYQELAKMFIGRAAFLSKYAEGLVFVNPDEKSTLILAYKSYLFSSSLNDRRLQILLNELFVQSDTMLPHSEWLKGFDEQNLSLATLLEYCTQYTERLPMELINE